jgi:hypothetical protein
VEEADFKKLQLFMLADFNDGSIEFKNTTLERGFFLWEASFLISILLSQVPVF